jgi:hypothetical protein
MGLFLRHGGGWTLAALVLAAMAGAGWAATARGAAAAVCLVSLAAGLAPLPIILHHAAAHRRTRHSGRPRPGAVVDVLVILQSRQMLYSWHASDGQTRTGRSRVRGRNHFDALPPGTAITVIDDPGNPALGLWQGDAASALKAG